MLGCGLKIMSQTDREKFNTHKKENFLGRRQVDELKEANN